MSTETNTSLPSASPTVPVAGSVLATVGGLCATTVRAVAFWAAVLLPFVALVALTTSLIGTSLPTIAGLVGVNALCAVVGHDYSQ